MQASFIVDPEDLGMFRTHWERKMRKNYRGMLSKMKEAGKKPNWMSENLYARFVQYWESEDAKVNFLLSYVCNYNSFKCLYNS